MAWPTLKPLDSSPLNAETWKDTAAVAVFRAPGVRPAADTPHASTSRIERPSVRACASSASP